MTIKKLSIALLMEIRIRDAEYGDTALGCYFGSARS
jgi:hypothetical protein